MKKSNSSPRKLSLSRETLRALDADDLEKAVGARPITPMTNGNTHCDTGYNCGSIRYC